MPLLDVRGLVKWYGLRKVVDGVSFHVNAGEVVGLLGPNGAGKTTSFRMTTGQVPPNDGQVFFTGVDVTALPMYQRARLGMGYLSQEPSIFRKLTVEKNLVAILEALPRSRTLGRRLTRSERWARVEEALKRFKLDHVRRNPAARCSGGEKRRLEIARCLVCEPLLILLDEPFAAVDPITKEDLRSNIRALADQGIGILLTDHDVREVLKITDRSYIIQDGKVVVHGTPEQIKRDPVAVKGYLGSTFAEELDQTVEPILLKLPRNEEADPDPEPPKPRMPMPDLEPLKLPSRPVVPSPAGQFSGTAQRLLEQEKLRRLVEQLLDRERMAEAVAGLTNHGLAALPVLADALERRELELRHIAHRLLEQLLGEQLLFDATASDELRLRQAAFIRARIERRRSA